MAVGDSNKVVMAALLANAGIAVTKGFAAFMTGSGAMLAETIHSVADSGNQALLLLGAKRSKRPPDRKHPFGYGSERYFWAFVVALVLFSLGSLFSLYEGVHKLLHPSEIRAAGWAYAVLTIGLVLEGGSLFIAHRAVVKARGKRPFWKWFFSTKDPNLPLVYLEDIGAEVGLLLAMLGVAGADLGGLVWADAAATLAVGALLGCIAVVMFVRCHRLLLGEAATEEDEAAVRTAVQGVPGVHEIRDLKTLQIGPYTVLVALEARLDETDEPGLIRRIEAAIRERVPAARYVAIEPVGDPDALKEA